ncbi:hypothetical protein LCGC14_0318070 [marine sediment metagenome]|uniref:Uncharacterized protein n=1 Tax=marine sediment metagenome TaxID=412755 RepID=A0A0F9WRZ5_9ZZZZ
MRIWFEVNGDVECRIRLHEHDDDIVFRTQCQDKGMQGIMVDLLNTKLRRAIEDDDLRQGPGAPRVDQEDPQGTEKEEVVSIGEDESSKEQAVNTYYEEDPAEV